MVNLDELMRLHAASTPGPWEHKIDDAFTTIHTIEPSVASYVSPADAAYIVAACNYVPEVVSRIRKLERQLEFWKRTAKKLAKNYCFICYGSPKECPRENDNVRVDPIPSCRLKHARRAVKNEMFVNAKVAGRRKVNDDI